MKISRRRFVPALLAAPAIAAQAWKTAAPGYRYSFPADHFSHPEFQTEWWYFTGNLYAEDGKRFGYELTFFRQANETAGSGIWSPGQIYLAHLALTDIDGRRFFHTGRLNRAGPGLAGASLHDSRYWNGNWQVRWLQPGVNNRMQLEAVTDELHLRLQLDPAKPAVIHGRDGISRKGPANGEASHYISFTHIASSGALTWNGRDHKVAGLSWMDHEFFTEPNDNGLAGWDWFSIQLDNNTELMLYRLRRDGAAADFSSGTFIAVDGTAHFLNASDFQLQPGAMWKSPATNAAYPVSWILNVPPLALHLEQTTPLPAQELKSSDNVSPTYWEGAVDYRGTMKGQSVKGQGYLEMTGYGSRMRLGTR